MYRLIALASLALVACGTTPPAETPAPAEVVVEAPPAAALPAAALNVTMPEGWAAVEGAVIDIHYMKGTTSFMVKPEPFTETEIGAVTAKAIEIYKSTFTNVVLLGEPAPIQIAGVEGRKFVFTGEVGGLQMKYLSAYFMLGGKTYAATFGGLTADFDTLAPEYDAILGQLSAAGH